MGREIRRVPPNWKHHRMENGHYRPLNDRSYADAKAEYDAAEDKEEAYLGPPEEYRPAWTEAEATAYQIYETVSEGTPTSPVFESLVALQRWLIEQGYTPSAAAAFAAGGWVPSMVMANGRLYSGIEAADVLGQSDKWKLD